MPRSCRPDRRLLVSLEHSAWFEVPALKRVLTSYQSLTWLVVPGSAVVLSVLSGGWILVPGALDGEAMPKGMLTKA